MKKHESIRLIATVLLLLLSMLLTLTACRNTGTADETGTDAPTDTAAPGTDTPETDTQVTPDTAEPTDTEPAEETEPATEAPTEPETDYDITQPEVMASMIETVYYNVRDYGAVGDGLTDDTKAVQDCLLAAYRSSGVAYFPAGHYLVYETTVLPKNDGIFMSVMGDGADTVIIGDPLLEGPILDVRMKYNFRLLNLCMQHDGQGSCVDALYLEAKYCRFTGAETNKSDVVVFHGSNCRAIECSFDVNCPEVYGLSYIKTVNEISINDHIVDNVFRGAGMGIRVGDGDFPDDGRCEGLKINGNYFYNTGAEQIRVTEILHINIAHNVMKNCSGSAIVLTQLGHGADGVFINDNRIELGDGAQAALCSLEGGNNYISSVNFNNNTVTGGRYGVYDPVIFTRGFIRANTFRGQSAAAVCVGTSRSSVRNPYYFFDNIIDEPEGTLAFDLPCKAVTGVLAFERNVTNVGSSVVERYRPLLDAGITEQPGENLTRRTAGEPSGHNEYNGDPDIGQEGGIPAEPETDPVMEVAVISSDPVEADLFGTEDVVGADALDMAGEVTMHFAATASFDRITVICPSWGDSIGTMTAKLYVWNKNIRDTLKGEPIASVVWENFPDNAHNSIAFDALPAGEYALVLYVDPAKQSEHCGLWVQTRKSTYMKVYKNGALCDGLEINHATIHYTETPEVTLWPASKDR